MTFIPTIVGSGTSAYAFLQRTRETQEENLRASTREAQDIQAVRDRLPQITNAEELLGDRQVLQVVLTAFGLEGDLDNRGFLNNVLNSDPNAPGSFANRLADDRYADLARSFNFGGIGSAGFPGATAKDTLTQQFQTLTSPAELFDSANRGLLVRAAELFGITSDLGNLDFLLQVVTSDLSDPNSLVNRLDEPRYTEFAQAFDRGITEAPMILRGRVSDDLSRELGTMTSAAELLENRGLLRSALAQFGLEDISRNTAFLEAVLDSDLNDPNSVANSLSDPRYAELAAAFNFSNRAAERDSIYGFADIASDNADSLVSADALLENGALLDAALNLFDLPSDTPDAAFLKEILEADTDDPESIVNRPANADYLAFSKAFGFGDRLINPADTTPTRIERLIDVVEGRVAPAETVDEVFADTRLYIAALNLFDLPVTVRDIGFAQRALEGDPNDPLSPINLTSNPGYERLKGALNLDPNADTFTYPDGFVDAVINDYVSRQFEISVGNQDTDMRLLLSLERDLTTIAGSGTSNDARWFQIMGSTSLRRVFEGALELPATFGQIDIEQQLGVFQERAERVFGTAEVSELISTENLAELERRYLGSTVINSGFGVPSPAASLLSILA